MHLEIYRALPDCGAVLHTHPRCLLALSLHLRGNERDFLRLPLFEAETWRARLGFAPALEPAARIWPWPWPMPRRSGRPSGWPGMACAAGETSWLTPCA